MGWARRDPSIVSRGKKFRLSRLTQNQQYMITWNIFPPDPGNGTFPAPLAPPPPPPEEEAFPPFAGESSLSVEAAVTWKTENSSSSVSRSTFKESLQE